MTSYTVVVQTYNADGLAIDMPNEQEYAELYEALDETHTMLRDAREDGWTITAHGADVVAGAPVDFRWTLTHPDGETETMTIAPVEEDEEYATVTVVVTADERDEFMRAMSMYDGVRFAASDDGVTDAALALGADVSSWDLDDEDDEDEDRDARVLYSVTAADLDALAGRPLTEDELTTFEQGFQFSTVGECVQQVLDSMGIASDEESDEEDDEPADVDPLAAVRVGDEDPTADEAPRAHPCPARLGGTFHCTRGAHPDTWQHLAGTGSGVVATWGAGRPAAEAPDLAG